ncbi:SRPBCC family protein [Aridibaculum aurantiacum]|uniref:SRPBCC family protein n=1 Tax=Aridibaculum aurantiacum TaxID=2810307 RepID=UPI001A95D0D6|nr:SRPBCC family protein [Aridibaculum aurantiacum]
MRFIKLALISVVVLFLIATAITSLLPSTIIVSRAIDIQASPRQAHEYVMDVRNWSRWLYIEDSSQAAVPKSKSEINYNRTLITILSSTPQKIVTSWKTGDSDPMASEFNIISNEGAPVFTFHWSFTQHVKWYPWEKFASILSDKALGPFMEKSLDNLKKQLEQNPAQ